MKKPSLFSKSCSIGTPESMEEEMNKRLFPKICMGHVGLFLTGVFLVIMEWMN
ncbi:hypothetical protein QWT69_01410 [Sporosarcina oncorhynchi]|uniref:Uncharacterized protein n=1 Tax=Sporosarcina oncorhynchi TaxID=3056444 RepID=A0ABZ0L840_9BACL|nr:hypothetical protein [Sporosarcina sp. T2O-4]WOV87807.1 hypothetical protein QWT69_01410 [Sporosarcina sp. T2O-4]